MNLLPHLLWGTFMWFSYVVFIQHLKAVQATITYGVLGGRDWRGKQYCSQIIIQYWTYILFCDDVSGTEALPKAINVMATACWHNWSEQNHLLAHLSPPPASCGSVAERGGGHSAAPPTTHLTLQPAARLIPGSDSHTHIHSLSPMCTQHPYRLHTIIHWWTNVLRDTNNHYVHNTWTACMNHMCTKNTCKNILKLWCVIGRLPQQLIVNKITWSCLSQKDRLTCFGSAVERFWCFSVFGAGSGQTPVNLEAQNTLCTVFTVLSVKIAHYPLQLCPLASFHYHSPVQISHLINFSLFT